MSASLEDRRDLVFAVCHEIGNLVAAIRLEAHLLDGDQTPLELARSSISIEDLSARVGALLTQIRPLLDPADPVERGGIDPAAMLAHLAEVLSELGGAAVAVDLNSAGGLPRVVGDPERNNSLLVLLGLGALESASRGGQVSVRAGADDASKQVWIEITDDGSEEPELDEWRTAARRGRALVLQVAEIVVEPMGGAIGCERQDGVNRMVLQLPRL